MMIALACAVGACGALEELGQYSLCTVDCDDGGGSPTKGGAPDATQPEEASDQGSDTGTPESDESASNDDSAADAERTDDSDGGDATPSDAGDATPGDAGDAGEIADAADAARAQDASDAGNGVDASDGGHGLDASADAGAPDAAGVADAGNDASDGAPATCAVAGVDAGLLVYYPFEGNTNDLSGNGNTGLAVVGTDITFGAGKLGQGVTIDASGQGVGVTGGTAVSGAKTLCAWVNPATGTAGQALPVFTGGMNYYDILAAGLPTAGGCLGLTASTMFMDNGACSSTSVTVTPGSWNLVCFAYGVGSTTFYANGSSQTLSGNQYDPYFLLQITIGSDRSGGSTTRPLFVGQIDEVSIWEGWLPGTAMNALYNGGNGCRIR